MTLSRLTRVLVAVVVISAAPVGARAQTPTQTGVRTGGSWLYALSFGVGRRTTSGAITAATLPAGASQPPAPVTIGTLDLEGGRTLTGRLAVIAAFDRSATLGTASGNWGTVAFHGGVRAWVAPRVWIEGGLSAAELAYRPPSGTGTTRFWRPGIEGAAGYEIFQGPTVSLQVFARVSTARVDQLRLTNLSVQIGLIGRR